jgi:uncharacterized membrane protein
MIPVMAVTAVLPSLLLAVILHLITVRRFRERPFGVRVDAAYAASQDAASLTGEFLQRVWLMSAVTAALSLAAVWAGHIVLSAFVPVLLIAGLMFAFRAGWKHVAPHALPPTPVRTASLAPERLPGGWSAALGPFVVLAIAGVYMASQWDRIPERFPVHWGFDGRPNGWSNRTPLGVFWPLGLAAIIQTMMLGIAWLSEFDQRRAPVARATRRVLVVTAWFIALVFALVTITPLMAGPPPVWLIIGGILGFVAWAVWTATRAASEPSDEPVMPESCWKWGQFYYNPDDPALFVEKRLGVGMTLNFARPASWVVLIVIVALPLALAAITAFAVKHSRTSQQVCRVARGRGIHFPAREEPRFRRHQRWCRMGN